MLSPDQTTKSIPYSPERAKGGLAARLSLGGRRNPCRAGPADPRRCSHPKVQGAGPVRGVELSMFVSNSMRGDWSH